MWNYYSNSRLKDQCMYRLNLKYNMNEYDGGTGFYALRGLVVEAGCIAKRYGQDVEAAMQERLREIMDENPELVWQKHTIENDFPSWIAGVNHYNPVEREVVGDQVEVMVNVKNSPRPIKGFIDLLERDENGVFWIPDIKCKGSLTKTVPKDWVWAATIYSIGIKQQYNLDYLPQGEIHMISVGKKPGFHCLPVSVTVQQVAEVAERVYMFDKYLELGWYPRNRAADSCSERMCSYFAQCHGETYNPNVLELFNEAH